MVVGHYAGAFVARGLDRRLPLGAAFLAVQLVDIGWDVAIATGVEHAAIVPGLASNPLDLYDMPYTHGLVATLVWALAAFAIVKGLGLFGGSTRVAAVVAFAVASHWALDALVHRADLPLFDNASPKLGFGLWSYPVAALAVELGVLAAAAAWYVARSGWTRRRVTRIGGLLGALAAIQIATVVGPLPPTMTALALALLAAYLAFAAAAHVVDRDAIL